MEDRLVIGRCLLTTGHMFGVFDGHGGHNFSELVSHRLFDYIALSILPPVLLKAYLENNKRTHLVQVVHAIDALSEKQREVHFDSLYAFAKDLLASDGSRFSMKEALHRAFIRLDSDVSREILEQKLPSSLQYAVMGACACVAHIDGTHLHVASTGDCKAVLGILADDSTWRAKSVSLEHNSDNINELRRVLSEHPSSEANTIIKQDRLLGQLAPLRAFGDFNYKWNANRVRELLVPSYGSYVLPPNYATPPYLTAQPEVLHRDRKSVV